MTAKTTDGRHTGFRWNPARADDQPAMEAVLRTAFTPYARAMGYRLERDAFEWLPDAVDAGEVWVARRNRTIAGVITISRHRDSWSLDYIAVAPRLQGDGLGRWMLHRLDETARAEGQTRITLHTAKTMTHLLRLYRQHGYRAVREGPPPHGRDANPRVYMEKRLG